MGYISLSWLWVSAPFWIPFVLVSLMLIGIVIVAFCTVDTNTKICLEEDFVSTTTNEANCNEDVKKVVLENTVKDAQPKKKRSRKKSKKDNSNEQNNTATEEGDTNK